MKYIYDTIRYASAPIKKNKDGFFLVTRADRIAALHESTGHDLFLPRDFIFYTIVPNILLTAAILSIIYVLSFRLVDNIVPSDATFAKKRRVCYQMTNFVMNCVLGAMGLFFYTRPAAVQADTPVEENITGFVDTYPLSCLQLGFQLWSIPLGFFYVQESKEMLLHHVSVVFVTIMTSFFVTGFRYWVPFFYGVMEISSVPLAVMNTFKDNPLWIEKQPIAYFVVRMTFVVFFLYIRVWLLVPIQTAYLCDHYLFWSSSQNSVFKYFMAVVWIGSSFLLFLQLHWANLILQGVFKQIFFKKSKDKARKQKRQ
jgi:hypothetical protein